MFVVAGVTGHVGQVVAKDLLAAGKKVKVIVRDAAKGAPWSKHGAEVAVGTLDDQAFLTNALRGAEGAFFLLPNSPFEPGDFFARQRKMADAIAGAVKEAKVPHVVMLSSVGADLPSGTGPIKGLHYFEEALRAAGTQLTAIRAGYFQENVGNAVAPAKAMGMFFNFAGSADYPMPMIATQDIGELAAQLLVDKPAKSESVDLHGPAYTVRQVAEKLGAALGKTLQVVDVPPAGHVAALVQAGFPQSSAEVFAEMYGAFASGKVAPRGDRLVQGKTPIDDVIRAVAR